MENILKSKIQYGFLSKRDKAFPSMVAVKITNVCNLECIHCPYSFISKEKNYTPRHMKWELYERIVTEVARHKGTIFRILCDGEPLKHPLFLDMIKFTKKKGISPMNFITNGMLLDEKMAVGILEAGVEVVEISLDAFAKSTYESIRKGASYEQVISNVFRFIGLRNKMKANTKIMVSIIDQPEVTAEMDIFVKYWGAIVDRVITRVYTAIGGLVDGSKMKIDNKGERWPCPQLWRRIFINVDGFAEFCVEDWRNETIIGDVNMDSIKDIWHSLEYDKIRQLHLSGKFGQIAYCKKCKDWKAREWQHDYFYALNRVLGIKG